MCCDSYHSSHDLIPTLSTTLYVTVKQLRSILLARCLTCDALVFVRDVAKSENPLSLNLNPAGTPTRRSRTAALKTPKLPSSPIQIKRITTTRPWRRKIAPVSAARVITRQRARALCYTPIGTIHPIFSKMATDPSIRPVLESILRINRIGHCPRQNIDQGTGLSCYCRAIFVFLCNRLLRISASQWAQFPTQFSSGPGLAWLMPRKLIKSAVRAFHFLHKSVDSNIRAAEGDNVSDSGYVRTCICSRFLRTSSGFPRRDESVLFGRVLVAL